MRAVSRGALASVCWHCSMQSSCTAVHEGKQCLFPCDVTMKSTSSFIQINSCNLPYAFCEQIGKEIKDISDEIPFEIPESWEWCRFGNAMINRDSERIPLSVAKRENLDKIYDYYGASGVIDKVDKYLFNKPLLLIGEDGANLLLRSKPIAFIARGEYWVNNHAHVLDTVGGLSMEYICVYINAINLSPYVTGTAQPKMNQEKMNSILVPIPPLSEQRKIVLKIEQLLPFIEKYEQAETQLTTLNTSFPEMLKKSILQEAVQGKLVPQNPDDEPASVLLERIRAEKQKLIKAGKIKKSKHESVIITRDKIPYEIPDSWVWCTLGSIINLVSGQDFDSCDFNAEGKGIPYLTGASNIIDEKIILNRWTDKPRCIANCGDLLIVCKGAGVGKMCILAEKEVHIARQIMSVQSKIVDIRYIKIFLGHNLILLRKSMQGVIPGISRNIILSMLLPLPPLAEQKRIVEKIEELMTFCEKLK